MLLDVNVLLSLAWPNHQFHGAARTWFARNSKRGWSTCAITQLGFVRLSSNTSFTEEARSPGEAAALLSDLTGLRGHAYLAELPPPTAFGEVWKGLFGHRQTTDAYLACVAVHHGTKLVTFDRKLSSLPGISKAVTVLE